jgi:3-deoxy-D-manno-octulosonic acid (KDO) 8-phosphate synthase
MKIKMFLRGDSPETHDAKDLISRIKETVDIEVEELDIEDREGKEVAEVYDIMATPAFLVIADDGMIMGSWVGKLPAEFEVKEVINL